MPIDLLQLIKADIKQLKRQKSLQSSQLGRSSLSNEESSRSATNHSSSMTADSSVTLRSQSSSPVNSMGGLLRSMSEPSMSADTSDSHVLHTCGDDSLPSSALGLQRRMDKQHRRSVFAKIIFHNKLHDAFFGKKGSLLWPGGAQWRIYYHKMWGQLSTTLQQLLK